MIGENGQNVVFPSSMSAIESKLADRIAAFWKDPVLEPDSERKDSILTPTARNSAQLYQHDAISPIKKSANPWNRPATPKYISKQTETYTPQPKQSAQKMQASIAHNLRQEKSRYTPLTEISNVKIAQIDAPSSPPKTARTTRDLRAMALRLLPIAGISDSDFDKLIADFADERRRCIFTHNFQDSKHLTTVINHLCECQVKQRKEMVQKEAIKQLDEQVKRFEQEVAEFDKKSKELCQENRDKFSVQLMRLSAQHLVEQEELQKRWSTKNKIRQYSRASQELIQLRKQLKQEIAAENFDEAEKYQKLVMAAEERDRAIALHAMQQDFDAATEQLQKKHDNDIAMVNESYKMANIQILQKREKLRASFINRAKRLEQQKEIVSDQEKIWNQKEMQRRDDLAKGNSIRASMPSRRMKNPEEKHSLYKFQTTDTSIALPPLSFIRPPKTPKTPRPVAKRF